MSIGSLVTATKGSGAIDLICDALGIQSFKSLGVMQKIVTGAGDPTDNQATHDPGSAGVFWINKADNSVWFCYAWASASNHDWVEIDAST